MFSCFFKCLLEILLQPFCGFLLKTRFMTVMETAENMTNSTSESRSHIVREMFFFSAVLSHHCQSIICSSYCIILPDYQSYQLKQDVVWVPIESGSDNDQCVMLIFFLQYFNQKIFHIKHFSELKLTVWTFLIRRDIVLFPHECNTGSKQTQKDN